MRWGVLAVAAYLLIVLDVSAANALAVGPVVPSFMVVLLVFTSLFAPRVNALWIAWGLGLLVDLSTSLPWGAGRAGPLIGAHALGYPFACLILLQARSMLFRQRVLTVAAMTVVAASASAAVVMSIYAIHGWYPEEHLVWADGSPAIEALRRLGGALYSGILALPVGRLLTWTLPLWGFRAAAQRR